MAPKRTNAGKRKRGSETSLEDEKHGALTLRPELWEHLSDHPLDLVLSYLPAHKVVDTVKGISHWKAILKGSSALSYELLGGHGRNLQSSYGFLVYFLKNHDRRQLRSALSALEHESGEWVKFPTILAASKENSSSIINIKSGSSGLICVTRTWTTKSGMDMGVWNPILQTMRWLPLGAVGPECSRNGVVTFLNVMVDEVSKSYKLLAIFGYEVFQDNNAVPEELRGMIYIPRYSVYSSTSQDWSPMQFFFKRTGSPNERPTTPILYTDCQSVSCNRHVFLVTRRGDEDHDEVIHCYSSDRDKWTRLFMSKILVDLGYTFIYANARTQEQERCTIAAMVVQSNKLYIVVKKVLHGAQFFMAVVDLEGDEFGKRSVVECLTRESPYEGRQCRSRLNYGIVHWYGCEIRGRRYICGILNSSGRENILKITIDVETQTWVPCVVGCGCATVDREYRHVCKKCVSKGKTQKGSRKRSYHIPFKASWVPV